MDSALDNKEISYKQEVIRKCIHLVSLSIPIGYFLLDKTVTLFILIPITAIFVIFDVLSKKNLKIRQFVLSIFGRMIRKHELNEDFKLNGASWVLLSAVFCILVFPKIITVTGFTILIISDISAALFGRKFGKHKIFGKSYEGTLAFIVTAIGAVLFIGYGVSAPWTFFVMGIIAAVVAGIAELISKQIHVDDNLSIPISIGIVMWVGDYLFYHFAQISYLGFM